MKTANARGFYTYDVTPDTYGGEVTIHESSADPLDKVWLTLKTQLDVIVGPERVKRLYVSPTGQIIPASPVTARNLGIEGVYPTVKAEASAHLNLEQAKRVRDALNEWIKDQEFVDKHSDQG